MKKKLFIGILTTVTALALFMGVVACGDQIKSTNASDNAYVAVDINPSVEFVVKDGVVTSVRALNYDARVMLYGSEGIVGSTPSEAARAVAALALKYGYLTEDNASAALTVESENAESKAQIFESVSAAMTDEASKGGLPITVNENAGISAANALEKLKAQYPDNAAVQALDAADYRIIKSAMSADRTLTIERAAAMDLDDLTDIIEDAYERSGEWSDDKFELELERAEYDYLAAVAEISDAAYAEADAERGAEYAALRKAYLTLDRIEEIDSELAELSVITADDLSYIAEKLGLNADEATAFANGVTDGDGYIDEDAIERYLDKSERNFEGSNAEKEAFEELIEEIDDYLDEAEDRAETLSAELKAEAEAAANSVADYVRTGAMNTFDDVEEAAEILEERIEELEKYFDRNFTDEQKQLVAEYKNSVSEQLTAAKAAYDKAVSDAKTAMAEKLEEAQRLRLSVKA